MKINSLSQTFTKNAAQFILGKDVMVVAAKKWNPNKYITFQCWEVNYPEHQLPHPFGQVLQSKVTNGTMALQLVYLQHQSTNKATAKIYAVNFDAPFFEQWQEPQLFGGDFFQDNNAGLPIAFTSDTISLLQTIEQNPEKLEAIQKIQQVEIALQLLRYAIEQICMEPETLVVPACGFLSNNNERDKVLQAQTILVEEFEQMISIKELSRRVAINECYLKKGFKAMFGKTINEYQQSLRIAKAKELLQTEGLTVSEVANVLGYSSISHFSTAFKKATNMKPCELLK